MLCAFIDTPQERKYLQVRIRQNYIAACIEFEV
jgi:hypothetical protein